MCPLQLELNILVSHLTQVPETALGSPSEQPVLLTAKRLSSPTPVPFCSGKYW